jgi:hypothetical protein
MIQLAMINIVLRLFGFSPFVCCSFWTLPSELVCRFIVCDLLAWHALKRCIWRFHLETNLGHRCRTAYHVIADLIGGVTV